MHIITRTTLRQFWETYPDSKTALSLWYTRAKHARWQNLVQVQRIYHHAEKAGRLTVFDIKGVKYRLIVRIEYEKQEIYIRHVLTHDEYSKDFWKNDPWY